MVSAPTNLWTPNVDDDTVFEIEPQISGSREKVPAKLPVDPTEDDDTVL